MSHMILPSGEVLDVSQDQEKWRVCSICQSGPFYPNEWDSVDDQIAYILGDKHPCHYNIPSVLINDVPRYQEGLKSKYEVTIDHRCGLTAYLLARPRQGISPASGSL